MTRAYIRLDPAFDDNKTAYPDGPYSALIACFCIAEMQPQRGRFRNQAYLKALLGRRGRYLKYLIDHGDIVTLADGRLYIDGWDEWQEGDWKVGERLARLRHRMHRSKCNGGDRISPAVHSAGAGAGDSGDVGPLRPTTGFKEKVRAHGGKVPG